MRKGPQRSGKFYFKNEAEVMKELGLNPTPGSGSGWKHKEDGENDYVLAQLKSTDKASYRVQKLDIEKLEYQANVSHKIPLFVIQFLSDNSRYALVNIDDIPDLAKYLEFGEVERRESTFAELAKGSDHKVGEPKVRSSAKAREAFYREREKEWEERKWR